MSINLNTNTKISIAKIVQSATVTVPQFGQFANEIWGEIIANSVTLRYGLVTLHTDVVEKKSLPSASTTVALQADGCEIAPSVANSFDLSAVELVNCSYSFVDRICLLDFKGLYTNAGVWASVPGAGNYSMQAIIQNEYMRLNGEEFQFQMEEAFWSGDTAVVPTATNFNITNCDGILKKVRAALGVHAQNITGPVLTLANILTELQTLYAVLPEKVLFKRQKDYFIIMSQQAQMILNQAWATGTGNFQGAGNIVAGLDNRGLLTLVNNQFYYMGIPVYSSAAIARDTIFFSCTRNLHWGLDLVSDYSMLRIIDEYNNRAGSRSMGVDGRMSMSNAFIFATDCAIRHL